MSKRLAPCANPLFEKWLEEWKDWAVKNDSSMQYNYARALTSLRQYPLHLESGKECLVLRNFGSKLCSMLDKKLERYKAQNNLPMNPRDADFPMQRGTGEKIRKIDNQSKTKQVGDAGNNNNNRKGATGAPRPYIPKVGSASYAILVTLYKKSLEPDYSGFMYKNDILTEAQDDCECPLKGNALQHYAGWSSMSTLIEKNLVVRKSCPAKFSLTDAGLALAISLYESKDVYQTDIEEEANNSCSLPSTSKSNGYKKSSGPKSSRSTDSRLNPSKENDVVDLDSYDDDVFQQDIEETDYHKFCEKNPEPLITVKRRENHFLFTEVLESQSSVNEINHKTNSQNYIDTFQKKAEVAKNANRKVVKSSLQKKKSTDEIPCDPFFLLANNFDIILLVDTQETCGNKMNPKDKDDITISELNKYGILYEVRNLKVGDFLWIARCRLTNKELVLPYIIERKRMDDLSSSIKDGRYHEQKFRLRQSGIDNVIYLVENYDSIPSGSIPLPSLLQAAVNSLIQDDFDLKFTKDHRDTVRYLVTMTTKLTVNYEDKELRGCPKKDLRPGQLMEFNEFNKAAGKNKNYSVQEMLIRQLVQLKGVSIDKAAAIANLYPTPKILADAFRQSDDKMLAGIESGPSKRKIGPTISKTFHQLYTRFDSA